MPETAAPPSMPPAAPPEKPKRVDLDLLDPSEVRERTRAIYEIEKTVEAKRAAYEVARKKAKEAKVALREAEESLHKEIREQRDGPGPLYDGVSGSATKSERAGRAKGATKKKAKRAKRATKKADADAGPLGPRPLPPADPLAAATKP